MLHELSRWFVVVPVVARMLAALTNQLLSGSALQIVSSLRLPYDWQLLFYAAFLFMAGGIVYEIWAPKIMKEHTSYFSFSRALQEERLIIDYFMDVSNLGLVDSQRATMNLLALADNPNAKLLTDEERVEPVRLEQELYDAQFSGSLRALMRFVWQRCDKARIVPRLVAFSFYVLGFMSLALAFVSDLHVVLEQSISAGLAEHLWEVVIFFARGEE